MSAPGAPRVVASRWPVERRIELVLGLLSGKLTLPEAAARHGLPAAEIEEWHRRFLEGGAAALDPERRPIVRPPLDTIRRLESIIDGTTAVIYAKDLEGRYLLINRQFERVFNVTREIVLGRTDHDLFEAAFAAAFQENDRRVIAAGAPLEFEETVPHPDGTHTYISLKFPLLDAHGVADAMCGISTDITERKRAEERLQQVRAELAAFYQAQPDLIFKLALDGTIVDYKAGQTSELYLPPGQFLGRRMGDVLPPAAGSPLMDAIARLRSTTGTTLATIEYVLPMPDGQEHHFEARLTPLDDWRILVLVRDISARKRAEEDLRLLARRLVTVREDERQRLGFDLHDGVCQELAGIGILVAAARAHLPAVRSESAINLDRVGEYIKEVIEHIRKMAQDLRPMLLHGFGLEEGLRSLAMGFARPRHRVLTNFADHLPRLDESIEIAVFRVAQEALTNAARHADARLTTLTLAAEGETLRLIVQDDGRGFDVRNGSSSTGLGIASMEQRALALDARFELRSEVGRGTTVIFECPVRLRPQP